MFQEQELRRCLPALYEKKSYGYERESSILREIEIWKHSEI